MFSQIDWNRLLSLLVAVLYLVIAFFAGGGEAATKSLLFLLLPMAAIWYGDVVGDFTSTTITPLSVVPISGSSPGIIVIIVGWILLLSPIIGGIISAVVSAH